MPVSVPPVLGAIERRLRSLLPAQLYAEAWLDPCSDNLMRIFQHLRTLLYILGDHVPPPVKQDPPIPGGLRYRWHQGTLLFTDLAGFTPFMESHIGAGQQGAERLLELLNHYFSTMTAIVSKSGGELLEFTGDAIVAQFLDQDMGEDDQRAVRAGLRMQRAMGKFQQVQTPGGMFDLKMRVGLHRGAFLTADLGTPLRMERVLLGEVVKIAKQSEGAGQIGRVCLTRSLAARLEESLSLESWGEQYCGVIDHFSEENLGEYEISLRRRQSNPILFDRSPQALLQEIETLLNQIEPLVSYQPIPILKLLVEHAADRSVPPQFPKLTVLFVSLLGIFENISHGNEFATQQVLGQMNHLFARIHGLVHGQGGVLQRITYHPGGSALLIYFGTPNGHHDDPLRAMTVAWQIVSLLETWPTLSLGEEQVKFSCQVGVAYGPVFAAEIGEARGRREYNILGDTVNTAARLMGRAQPQQILLTEGVYQALSPSAWQDCPLDFAPLGSMQVKGKSHSLMVYTILPKIP